MSHPHPFKRALLVLLTVLAGVPAPAPASGEELGDVFDRKRFSLNVRNGDLVEVIRALAERGGLEVSTSGLASRRINVSLKNVTLSAALDQIARENSLEYVIEGDRLSVGRGGRSPSSVSTEQGGSGSAAFVQGGAVREVPIQYAQAALLVEQIRPMISGEDRIVVDQLANTIVFQGSEAGFNKLQEIVKVLDRLPQQVLIEAQIVETSKTFLQAFGLSWGLTGDTRLNNTTAKTGFLMSTSGPSTANGALRYVIQRDWGGVPLDVRLNAAETNGDAKVISRPKVVTLNNTAANIQSGISFNIKTLSAVGTGGGAATTATGGVATLNAGLTLNVTPTIMGQDLIRLNIVINNSQPDESQIVDGIPGIVNNAATTSVIVAGGRTAVIAGLVKNTGGRSVASVPFFANIPILGAFFRNSTSSDRNNELVIFITPQIVSPTSDLKPARAYGEPQLGTPAG